MAKYNKGKKEDAPDVEEVDPVEEDSSPAEVEVAPQGVEVTSKKDVLQASNNELVQKACKRSDDVPAAEYELVKIHVHPSVKINGHLLEGDLVVPRHLARTILPMIQSKVRADIEIFTGKKVLTQFLSDGSRVFKPGG